MSDSESFLRYESDAAILQQIASTYVAGSKEHAALRRAALALLYAVLNHSKELDTFISQGSRELTAEQRRHLVELGLIDE